ncbi:MAG: hypothetical protein U0X91_11920 [Spirosomataceae bacterium]
MKITQNLTVVQARRLEQTDADAWEWMYQQLPESYQQSFGFSVDKLANMGVLTCQKIPFRHFNTPLGIGISEPMAPQQLESVLQLFECKNINAFYIHVTPFSEPSDFVKQLTDKGMRHLGSWERIWRDNRLLKEIIPVPEGTSVEEITAETANEWADFIDAVYRMPTKPWLLNLVDKPRFHAYVFRRNGRIVAARTMIINGENAWLGMDAPVPGIMAPTFEEDFFLDQKIVQDGLQRGVTLFSTDLEKPSPTRDTPAYLYWGKLGFEVAYLRDNYGF